MNFHISVDFGSACSQSFRGISIVVSDIEGDMVSCAMERMKKNWKEPKDDLGSGNRDG